MKARKIALFLAAVMLYGMLTACAGAPLVPADANADAMAVPIDDGPLGEPLRAQLHDNGWSLVEYDADALARNREYRMLARHAKYRLTLSADRIGNCRGETPSFLYNIAVIENASGTVRLALTGASCVDTIMERFAAGLERQGLTWPRVGVGG